MEAEPLQCSSPAQEIESSIPSRVKTDALQCWHLLLHFVICVCVMNVFTLLITELTLVFTTGEHWSNLFQIFFKFCFSNNFGFIAYWFWLVIYNRARAGYFSIRIMWLNGILDHGAGCKGRCLPAASGAHSREGTNILHREPDFPVGQRYKTVLSAYWHKSVPILIWH